MVIYCIFSSGHIFSVESVKYPEAILTFISEGLLPEGAMDDVWTKSSDAASLVGADSNGPLARQSIGWLGFIWFESKD